MAELSGWYFSNDSYLSGNTSALTPTINWYNTNSLANGFKMTNAIGRKLYYNLLNTKNELYKMAVSELYSNNSGGSGYLDDIFYVAGNGLVKILSGNKLIISANNTLMEFKGNSTFDNLATLAVTANLGDVWNLTTSRITISR